MTNFSMLPEKVQASLTRMNFTTPTLIQAAVIPIAIQGKDVLGSAQTGTGKTGAFGIPTVARLLNAPNMKALVLLPTRELAIQVFDFFKEVTRGNNSFSLLLLVGGEPMFPQTKQLRGKPRIVIGTPGRVNDHINRKNLNLSDTEIVIIDETDRMLDIGMGVQLEAIMKTLPVKRQTMMFSATFPPESIKLAQKYMNNPERIAVGPVNSPTLNIEQSVVYIPNFKKYQSLVQELNNRTGSVIVFVNTRRGAENLAQKLKDDKNDEHSVSVLHGNLQQNKRKYVINGFRKKSFRIMVATDVAARGLDVPHIETVINYDLPNCPEDYVHRIGRTGRANSKGCAVSLVAPEETGKWKRIKKFAS